MESYIQVSGGEMYVRHNHIDINRDTILLIHGLGASGICFDEIFSLEEFNKFNLVVPDMLGYGKSTAAEGNEYSFDLQVKRLWEMIASIGIRDFFLVGHSVGGDIGTLMCATPKKNEMIKKFVNIESDMTQYDTFITKEGKKADQEGKFESWFKNDFCIGTVLNQWAKNSVSSQRYYESLQMCKLEAFHANTIELYDLKMALSGEFTSVLGAKYIDIVIPKVFCYGSFGSDKRTIQFLTNNNQKTVEFKNAGHWVMIDSAKEFYPFVYNFLTNNSNEHISIHVPGQV